MIKDTYSLASSSPFQLLPGEEADINLSVKKQKKLTPPEQTVIVTLYIVIRKNGKFMRRRYRVVLPTSKAHLAQSIKPLQLLSKEKGLLRRLKKRRLKRKVKVLPLRGRVPI